MILSLTFMVVLLRFHCFVDRSCLFWGRCLKPDSVVLVDGVSICADLIWSPVGRFPLEILYESLSWEKQDMAESRTHTLISECCKNVLQINVV